MCDIICVTNRHLCKNDFLQQIEKIAKAYPKGIILREKDLSDTEYEALARKVMAICGEYDVPCILHRFVYVAIKLNVDRIHLPVPVLMDMTQEQKGHFSVIGASCHSVEQAQLAEKLGCTYITIGHIFPTDCKKGLAPRGTDFLKDICKSVSIPVYAIGGINSDNFSLVMNAGANGGCIMSGLMKASNPKDYLDRFDKEVINDV